MGKNWKGRECGKGICQKKDGKYSARYNNKHGRRLEKLFDTHEWRVRDSKLVCTVGAPGYPKAGKAIEYGMPPKTLQKPLGHASIKTTMDRYAHVFEDFMLSRDKMVRKWCGAILQKTGNP